MKSLAEEMKLARGKYNIKYRKNSLRMFEKITNFKYSYLSRIENKKVEIHALRFNTAKRIADIIGCTLDELYLMKK